MNLVRLHSLAASWRSEAELFRRRGLGECARLMESVAQDLEDGLQEWELEALSLEVAAEESGYSYSSLQQKVARGDLPNAGGKGSPRIRRCDLPQKGGRLQPQLEASNLDLADQILAARIESR